VGDRVQWRGGASGATAGGATLFTLPAGFFDTGNDRCYAQFSTVPSGTLVQFVVRSSTGHVDLFNGGSTFVDGITYLVD
jgi:hypothetical protein